MEPSHQTYEEIGRLCSAWAALEFNTERTVWGIIGVTPELGRFITWRLDIRSRWQLILEQAPSKVDKTACSTLRTLNKLVTTVTSDRNIIVHGLVHASVNLGRPVRAGEIVGKTGDALPFTRTPSWTVFRGAEAGKNFPISAKAAEIIRINVQIVGQRILEFNIQHGFTATPKMADDVEKDWPSPIP